jgi:RNA polymerase sigma factor (sigma-70 family)
MANASLGIVLRHLRGLVQTHAAEAETDGQLLERFTAGREEAAFAALLRRHGAMVLGVSRRVLGQEQDAEDVLQATFLLLAQKAGSIRRAEAVSGWLHAVALRLALKARGQKKMRQDRETQAAGPRPPEPARDVAWRELLAVLDEEVQRLPPKYRGPLVLCYLEGKTQEEAGCQLGCPLGTVRSRLARARQRLRDRLTRRGLTLSAGTLATVLAANGAEGALPALLFQSTLRAGLQAAAGATVVAGISAQTAALVKGGLPTLAGGQGTVGGAMLLLLAVMAAGALVLAHGAAAFQKICPERKAPPVAEGRAPRPAPQPRAGAKPPAENPKPARQSRAKQVTFTGRVLTPDGKPAARAHVAIVAVANRPLKPQEEWADRQAVLGVTRVDRRGHFRLPVRRPTSRDFSSLDLIAAAPGYGLAWQNLPPDTPKRNWVLRLRPEQVVRGRLVDLQGSPAKGVELNVAYVASPEAGEMSAVALWKPQKGLSPWPGPVTTDAEGRFVLSGLGRKQGFGLRVRDDRFALQDLHLATGDGKPDKKVTLLVGPPRIVEGRVTFVDTGKPVPSARVTVRCFTRRPQHSTFDHGGVDGRADAQGRFRMNSFAGSHVVVSAAAGAGTPYLGVSKDLAWPQGAVRQRVNLALVRGVLVRGKVTETPSGKPVGRVQVNFWPQLTENKYYRGDVAGGGGESGADGSFRLVVQAGPGTLVFRSPERNYIQQLVYRDLRTGRFTTASTIPENSPAKSLEQTWNVDALHGLKFQPGIDSREVRVVLRRGHTVHRRLVGPDGKPVARVRMLCPVPNASALTEFTPVEFSNGRFQLTGCDPDKTYPVLFLDAEHQWGAVADVAGNRAMGKALTVRLTPCGSARVRLLDAKGRPLPNYRPNPFGFAVLVPPAFVTDPKSRGTKLPAAASMRLVSLDRRHYPYPDSLKTDAQGRLTLPALIPGATYQLWERCIKTQFKAASARVVELADIKLP